MVANLTLGGQSGQTRLLDIPVSDLLPWDHLLWNGVPMAPKLKSNGLSKIRLRVRRDGVPRLETAALGWATKVLPLPSRRKLSPNLDDT